jgi:hypothetical protein
VTSTELLSSGNYYCTFDPWTETEVTVMDADEISQAVKRAILENDRKVGSTYHGHARDSADDTIVEGTRCIATISD